MNATRLHLILLGLAIMSALSSAASAQQQSRGDNWPFLLFYPAVQEDLGLSEQQVDRVGGILGLSEARRAKGTELERQMNEILTEGQRLRVGQIRYQALLARGALAPTLIEKLELSDDQKPQLNKVLEENEKQNAILLKRLKTENLRVPGARDKLKRKYYDAARAGIDAVLSPGQRDTLKDALGKEFAAAFDLAESL